jgi:hypothetical protein
MLSIAIRNKNTQKEKKRDKLLLEDQYKTKPPTGYIEPMG